MTVPSDEVLQDLLDNCFEMLRGGASVSACLERYPEYAAELEPLLNTIVSFQTLEGPVPARSPEVAALQRARFAAEAQRLASERSKVARREQRSWWAGLVAAFDRASRPMTPQRVPVGLLALLLVVVLSGFLSAAGVTASAAALPGDLLYPVKTATENARLVLARDPVQRDSLRQAFDEERLREAREITDLKRKVERLRLVGVVEAMAGPTWTISGVPVLIGEQTRIDGVPAPGARVEAILNAPGDGSLAATAVRVLAAAPVQPTPTPTPVSTPTPSATPTSRSSPTASPTLSVTSSPEATAAEVVLPAQTEGPLDDRPLADTPRPPTATSTRTSTPTRVPTRTPTVTVVPTSTPLPVLRLTEWVKSIEENRWTIGDVTVETDGNTQFIDNPALGYEVIVTYVVRPGGAPLALEIRTQTKPDAPPVPYATTGILESVNGDVWTVGGARITVTGDTVLENSPAPGDMVQVDGERLAGGEIRATRIKALREPDVQFEGVIQEITPGRWVVQGETLVVYGETQISGSAPAVGLTAQVEAIRRADGSLLALRIFIPPDQTSGPAAVGASQ